MDEVATWEELHKQLSNIEKRLKDFDADIIRLRVMLAGIKLESNAIIENKREQG